MKVILDGDSEPVGWVTGLTRDGNENLKLAASGFRCAARRAARLPYALARADERCALMVQRSSLLRLDSRGKETNSKKLDEIPKHTNLRVLEEATMPDGSVRAARPRRCGHD